jgi:hypothetical protein
MSHSVWNHCTVTLCIATFFALFALIISLVSCNKADNGKAEEAVVQKTFASPADAGAAFVEAVKSSDQAALLAIFGPDAKDILFSGDTVKDKNTLEDFAAAYNQMNRWVKIKAGGEILYIGADNYPFPIPLDQNSSGQWYFDTAAGADEVLARRIGKGELTAIAACNAIARAQAQYFGQTHDGDKVKQYAQKFVSDEGKHNGLYWPAQQGQPPSPLGPLGDFAKALGYSNAGAKPQPFDGYYFQMLTKQGDKAQGAAKDYIKDGKMTGGFAVIAYHAEYRKSGIMTLMVGTNGILYQKDLGEETDKIAAAMTEYDRGDGWSAVVGTEEIGE